MYTPFTNALLLSLLIGAGLWSVSAVPIAYWFVAAVATLAVQVFLLFFALYPAGGTPIRSITIAQALWITAGAIGLILLTDTAWVQVIVVCMSVILLLINQYHAVRFVEVPGQRSRVVLLLTARVVQACAVYMTTAVGLGVVVTIHESIWWAIGAVMAAVVTMLYPFLRLVEQRAHVRWLVTMMTTVAMVELVWSLLLLPIGYTLSAIFAAILYLVTTHLVLQETGDLPRETRRTWLVAACIGLAVTLVLFLVARW